MLAPENVFQLFRSQRRDTSHRRRWPWQDDSLTGGKILLSNKPVTMLSHLFSEEEGMVIYGSYKQVDNLKGAKTEITWYARHHGEGRQHTFNGKIGRKL